MIVVVPYSPPPELYLYSIQSTWLASHYELTFGEPLHGNRVEEQKTVATWREVT